MIRTENEKFLDSVNNRLVNNLKALRAKTGLSMRDFAKEIGISHISINNYENKHHTISLNILKKYSEYSNIPIEMLLFSEL